MLLQNLSTFTQYPVRQSGFTGADLRFSLGIRGDTKNNRFVSEAGFSDRVSIPDGYKPEYSWAPSLKGGNLSSFREAQITFSETGVAVRGLPATGSSTITFTQTGTGGLVVSGSGSATITFSPTAVLISVASGSGSATVTFTPTAAIGAEAGLSGASSIDLTGTCTSYAIGYMSGLSTSETEFSAAALAQAVWTALASDYNTAGTMGEKLNDAGAAGNPWAALLADNDDPDTFGERIQKLLTTNKFIGLK